MMLLVVSFTTSMLFLGMKLIYLQNLHRLFESSFEGVLEFLRKDIAPRMALRVLNMGVPSVTKEELKIRMKSVGFNARDSDINRIFARLDTRHCGRVAMTQFCDALEGRMGSRRPSALQSLMGDLFAELSRKHIRTDDFIAQIEVGGTSMPLTTSILAYRLSVALSATLARDVAKREVDALMALLDGVEPESKLEYLRTLIRQRRGEGVVLDILHRVRSLLATNASSAQLLPCMDEVRNASSPPEELAARLGVVLIKEEAEILFASLAQDRDAFLALAQRSATTNANDAVPQGPVSVVEAAPCCLPHEETMELADEGLHALPIHRTSRPQLPHPAHVARHMGSHRSTPTSPGSPAKCVPTQRHLAKLPKPTLEPWPEEAAQMPSEGAATELFV
jgi:hypothetical protein